MAVEPARAKSLFLAASDLANRDERAAYLNRECAGDLELRERVEGLLRANDDSPLPEQEPEPKYSTGAYPKLSPGSLFDSEVAPNAVIAGKYKLVEEIGAGGMGHVYLAQQTEPIRRAVAVKVVKAGMDSKAVLARFEAERQALAMMDHPNIARVFDAGMTDGGRPFFVMELIQGVPITELCDERKLTLRQRLELFIPVCQAIQHAHQKDIIHRDIKPSNVLMVEYDDKPVAKVIDFGVAKAVGSKLTDKTMLTEFGAVIGTLEYMSPEQAKLNALDIDTRSDIYALGVLLYELLTGTTPFDKNRLKKSAFDEVLRIIREEEPPKPSTRLSQLSSPNASRDDSDTLSVPTTLNSVSALRRTEPAQLSKLMRGELDWIVMKCLEKDRNRRYDTANSLAMDLQRYLADEPVLAGPPSAAYRLRKFVRRRRAAMLLAAGLVVFAAILATGGWLYRRATRDSEHAQRVTEAHEKIPLVQAAIRKLEYPRAFDLLREIEPLIPEHPSLPDLWEQCSLTCTPTSVPSGADVWLRPYDQPDAPWRHVIRTTDRAASVRVPRGEHFWRATKPGYGEVTGLRPAHATWFQLDPDGAIPADMVRIPKGQPNRPGMAETVALQSVDLPDFLIDRHEVTNAQYDRFVKAGGYDRPDYWQDMPFVGADGNATTWGNVKPLLVDQTGRPGPASWRDGTFKPGEEDHPVRGVSWYEATAYARFAGKSLPTIYHWTQASQVELSVVLAGNEYITRSNFGLQVRSVRSLGDHGIHGTFGTIGNVKEWCCNDTGDGKRFILGGGCGEPIYTPLTLDSSPPLRRDEFFGFRCVKFFNDQKGPAAAWSTAESIPWPTPPRREDLMDVATFRLVVQDRFTYDRSAPLDVTSEQIDEGEWIHISAQINAAYRDAKGRWERMPVHLYLPKGIDASKGYQTVVYFPGGDAHMLPRIRPLAEEYGLDAIVRSGRAVLRPVYQGMYERRYASFDADDRTWEERHIYLGQDLMRAIDYLQHRGDINMDQVGYHGFSWGANSGGGFVAVESRLRAVVFEAGGLSNEPLRKERAALEWRHYLPQIQAPVLMINGQTDPIFPVKESQVPMFRLIGSSIKEHYIHPTGHHMLPPAVKFEHMTRWFDRHLGSPAKARVQR